MFGPAGGDVCAVEGVGEQAQEGVAAVGDGIGFKEAGAGFVPLVEFDGDLVSEEGSGFGGGASSFFVVDADGMKDSVDGSGGDVEEGLRDL